MAKGELCNVVEVRRVSEKELCEIDGLRERKRIVTSRLDKNKRQNDFLSIRKEQ